MGAFISKPGYDVLTAAAADMLLNASERYSNLLKLGIVYGNTTVALGYGASPFVLITTFANVQMYIGSSDAGLMYGAMRPWPAAGFNDPSPNSYAVTASDGSYLTISTPAYCWYAVYSRVFSS